MTSATLETQNTETGGVTGTADKDYNIIWFLQQCLSNVLRLEIYIHDAERAEDQELADRALEPAPASFFLHLARGAIFLEAGKRGAHGARHTILREETRGLVARDRDQCEIARCHALRELTVRPSQPG